MRLVYVLTSLGIGGAEKQVLSLAEKLAGKGHNVTLIVLKNCAGQEWPVKLPVMRLDLQKTAQSVMRGLRFAARFLVIVKPDIIHSHTYPANIFARLLRVYRVRAFMVNTIHNMHEGGWHRMMLYRISDPLVDRVTAVSSSALGKFVRMGSIRKGKSSLLTNGIDTETFVPDGSRRRRMRADLPGPHTFLWLAVGRLVPAKDYPNLLRAFALVRQLSPDAMLWIAGEGDQSAYDFIAREVGDHNQGVTFLGMQPDIAGLLDAADGYVLASAWEGMPLALGEAMAMAKCIVATDVGGVRELVADAGLIVGAGDSDALASSMLRVMRMNRSERNSLGERARDRIQEHFSMEAKAVEWEEAYGRWLLERCS